LVTQKDGRRNRCQIQVQLPRPGPAGRERTVGENLALLVGEDQLGNELPPARLTGRRSPPGGCWWP